MRAAWTIVVLAACTNGVDPRWQLAHDRIIAVRATPPHVPAGAVSELDALVTSVDGGPADIAPLGATADPTAPAELASAIAADGQGGWQVTAPDDATLAQARTDLGLAATDPVPLEVDLAFSVGGENLLARKQVFLGDAADNPPLDAVTVNGAPPQSPIQIPYDTDVTLSVAAASTFQINWLSSCGTLNSDDNEPTAVLHVNPGDPTSGQLVLVERDPTGGVVWQIWEISAPAP
ncbi:MAG TPA: hypothetical protein VMJ10_03900 [Kofleriaceae bacterium]|nr:hypothetical protein [Kofleriaceae bacterium]